MEVVIKSMNDQSFHDSPNTKRLLRRTYRQLYHARRTQPVLDDGVNGVAISHVDRAPAVFVAVGFERFDGAGNYGAALATKLLHQEKEG